MKKFKINEHIVVDRDICHGRPTFDGTRVMVWQVLEMLADGVDNREIFKAYPSLTKEHLRSAFDYTSSITRDNNVLINFHVA